MAVFQIWDIETANMVGAFPTLDAALLAVREAIAIHGAAYVEAWALEREDERQRVEPIAGGAALVARARASIPA